MVKKRKQVFSPAADRGGRPPKPPSGPRDPSTFAGRLRILIDRAGSAFALTQAAGLSSSMVAKYLAGTVPGIDTIARVSHRIGVRAEWLAHGTGAMLTDEPLETGFFADELVSVPLIEAGASAGHGRVYWEPPDEAAPRAHAMITRAALQHAHANAAAMIAIRIIGNSMAPDIPDGSTAFVDRSRTLLPPKGGIYLIATDDGLRLKHVRWTEGGLLVESSSSSGFPPETIAPPDAERVHIVGRLVYAQRPPQG